MDEISVCICWSAIPKHICGSRREIKSIKKISFKKKNELLIIIILYMDEICIQLYSVLEDLISQLSFRY